MPCANPLQMPGAAVDPGGRHTPAVFAPFAASTVVFPPYRMHLSFSALKVYAVHAASALHAESHWARLDPSKVNSSASATVLLLGITSQTSGGGDAVVAPVVLGGAVRSQVLSVEVMASPHRPPVSPSSEGANVTSPS